MPNPNNYKTRSQSKEDHQTVIYQQPGTPLRPPQPIEPIVQIDTTTEADLQEIISLPSPVNPQQVTEEDDFFNEIEEPTSVQTDFYLNMNSHIHLDNFKGQGEDPNKWFTYFERWAAFMNMNGDRAAMALPFYLKGIAKTWFDSLSEATQVNLDLLKTAFLNRFSNSSTVDISVLTIAQRSDESAEEYYARFVESSHAKAIPENIQVSILMKGLKPTLLTLVMPKNPQTLEDMRQAMVLAEQTTNASASRSVNSADSSLQNEIMCLRNQLSEVLAIQKQNSDSQPQSHWSHQEQHVKQSWQQPPRPSWEPYQQMPPHQHYGNQQRQRRPWPNTQHRQPQQHQNASPGQPFHCYYCGGKRFHLRKNCPASGQKCHQYGKIGHFQTECKGGMMTNQPYQK